MVDVACLVAANAVDTPRILVVEDGEPESPTALAVRAALRAEGYEVEIAIGASEGLRRFVSQPPALVLLNARRPRTPWIEMCKRMQAVDDVPIIIGFHLPSQIDTVLAFELGAAGYISEPNRLQELVARIRAALRVSRTTRPRPSPRSIRTLASREDRFVVDALSVDFAGREVTVAGERVHLSRLEFDLLALLLSPPDVVRTRDEIIERIWSDRKITGSRTLDTHVRRLRLKLGEDPASSGHLVTVRGVGFRFDTDGHKGRLPTGC
jgi:two-component system response regulator RegX3